ncbi:MAG: Gldg family protein [Spirochaetales bacterium]|nr:Gldg family protein [Spirochaetales bacterium]
MDEKKKTGMKPRNYNKYIIFGMLAVIVVIINIIGIQLFLRVDLTDTGMYSLSAASKEAVATLQEPLTVKVFFSDDLPAEYIDLRQYVEDLLEEYSVNGNRYFNYSFYDVGGESDISEEQENNQSLANDYGIYPIQIEIYKNDAFSFKKAYMGMVLIHGDIIETINRITAKEKLEYNITTTIRKMNNKISALLALSDNIDVKLFLSSDLYQMGEALEEIPGKLEEIMKKLNKENYGKLDYTYIDTSKNPELASEAEKYNLLSFVKNDPDNPDRTINLYAGIVIEYGDKTDYINILEKVNTLLGSFYNIVETETLDIVINDAINNLIDINERIGYLKDHGTAKLDWQDFERQAYMQMHPNENIAQVSAEEFEKIISEHYTIDQISLIENRIPAGIECLIIAGPKESFSEWELFQIDQFLMQGKSLAIFLDGLEEVNPETNQQLYGYQLPKEYPPVKTGIEKLLEHYGVTVKSSYIFDKKCYKQHHRVYGDFDIYFIPEIQNEFVNEDLKYMKNVKGFYMIQPSPIKLNEDKLKENNISSDILFSSSNESWESSENINLDDPNAMYMPDTGLKSYPLAVMLEGEFPSFFENRAVPEPPKKETEEGSEDEERGLSAEDLTLERNVIKKAVRPGKLFVVGTSQIVRDIILTIPQNGPPETPNRVLISNILDYLNNRADYAVMRSKLQVINPLDATKTTPLAKDVTRYFNLIGLPLIVAVCGLFVLLTRGTRRRKIQVKFLKK